MSASFVPASSQYLSNSAVSLPSTGYPFTVGFWAYPVSLTNTAFSLAATTSDNNYLSIEMNGSVWRMKAAAGGVANVAAISTTTVANAWQYVLFRCLSASNRRLSALHPDGGGYHALSTTTRAPTGITCISMGGLITSTTTAFFSGMIAEFFYTNTDIQPDGLQLSDSTLRQLAFGGPFSVPSIVKDIQEYRSLWSALDSSQDVIDEYDHGGDGRKAWVNTNGVTRGSHPPLSAWYEEPIDIARNIPV